MEYLEVGDLEKYLIQSRQSKLPEQEIQLIVRQIVQGLTLMHQNRFAHRDLQLKVWRNSPSWQLRAAI